MPFVVFEGGEGVGKSTQIESLREALTQRSLSVSTTREPGGTPFAECLRRVFKDDALSSDEPTPWAELLLVASARAQHLERMVRPALSQGQWVLCDRFLDSAVVYQGARGRLGFETVMNLHRHFMGPRDVPDLTLVLDLPTRTAMGRVQVRQGQAPQSDRLDHMSTEQQDIIRQGFLDIVSQRVPYPCGTVPKRVIIDASQSLSAVTSQIWKALREAPTLGTSGLPS